MHAGPTLLAASLNRHYYITGCRKVVRSVTHGCVICRRSTAKPKPQLLGQVPVERITPDSVFNGVGVDYAGPFLLKYGSIRKPSFIKAYVCLFVSLSTKAVHLELASDLSTDAFIAALRRFVARRGKPSLIWSDHGTNFVGAVRELKEFVAFFQNQKTQGVISEFCAMQNITWKSIPERTPDTIEPLTPGHFLIGRPLEALPDPPESYRSISLLQCWHLCQNLIRHSWKRWVDPVNT
jgi:hypothetical protein